MLSYKKESLKVKKISEEERKKEERLRDVTLLLQQIVQREETSLKLIIDCLIDVGSINYANAKLSNPPLNKIMKVLVGYIKPVARTIALGWLKKNLPDLLTAWLESKVSFEPVPISKDQAITGNLETVPNTTDEAVTSEIEAAPFKESFGN
ncbi:hypothetical protein [Waterburya agarophytonicola]|uniref:hypothetical protein n=1 Tax=Waterburya agarophytonicola TaxID=2886916 RepID=UPI001E5E710B|nr:hypothetical protein [Waterburya agarophytonicola]